MNCDLMTVDPPPTKNFACAAKIYDLKELRVFPVQRAKKIPIFSTLLIKKTAVLVILVQNYPV